jgi:hypothetical protein
LTAQDPAESVQAVAGEKLATPLLAQVMVPVGEVPDTPAVQVLGEPMATGDREHVTAVVVTAFTTESEKRPELSGLFESPP